MAPVPDPVYWMAHGRALSQFVKVHVQYIPVYIYQSGAHEVCSRLVLELLYVSAVCMYVCMHVSTPVSCAQ